MVCTLVTVENEYNKDPDLKKDDVQALLGWASKQAHLPKISEFQAIQFLQSCYYRLEPAKNALDNYFTIRTLCPDIFNVSLDNTALKMQMEITCIAPLPKLTPEGYRIIYARLLDPNPDLYNYTEQTKLCNMVEILDLNMNGTHKGVYFIGDMHGGTFGHLAKLNLNTAKRYNHYLQEALPFRLKGIHMINVVSFIDKVMALMKPFLKKELLEMIHFHNSLDSLCNFIPKECLPEDLGGTAPSILELQKETNQKIIDNIDFFTQHQQQRVDESKRQGKSKSDMFGMEGSFKKLEFD